MSTHQLLKVIKSQLQTFSVNSYVYQNTVANDFNLHPTDMLAIHHLDQNGEMTAGRLAKSLGLTSGAATAAVDRLVKMGFVSRRPGNDDRRKVYVYLNKPVLNALKSRYAPIDQRLEKALVRYSEEHLVIISRFLDDLTGTESRQV